MNQVKEEAEKIIKKFRNCIVNGVYLSDDQINQISIIHVEGLIEAYDEEMTASGMYLDLKDSGNKFIIFWQSVLTHLKSI